MKKALETVASHSVKTEKTESVPSTHVENKAPNTPTKPSTSKPEQPASTELKGVSQSLLDRVRKLALCNMW